LIISDGNSSDSDYGEDSKKQKKPRVARSKPKPVEGILLAVYGIHSLSVDYFDYWEPARRSLRNLDRKQYQESDGEEQDDEEEDKSSKSTNGRC
jgi:hypothetical protein